MAALPIISALVVDDNYYNRDLCRLALEHAGYSVVEAESGQEALRILDQQTYDLLVLDLAMPDGNGIDVINEISHQSRHQAMPIIVMTANPHMATEEVELEVEFVLCKPIDVQVFTRFAQRLAKTRQSE
ncbi:MAG: response regulator [Chloroflexota bacterium]